MTFHKLEPFSDYEKDLDARDRKREFWYGLVSFLAFVTLASMMGCTSQPVAVEPTNANGTPSANVVKMYAALADNQPQAGDHMPWCPKGDDGCLLCACLCAMGPKDPPKNNVPLPTEYPWGWLNGSDCLWCPNLPGRDE